MKQTPEAKERERQPSPVVDEQVKRYFVIRRDVKCVPEKKGPFTSVELMTRFLREAIDVWPKDSKITLCTLTWDDDLWVDCGREYLHIMDSVYGEAAHRNPGQEG